MPQTDADEVRTGPPSERSVGGPFLEKAPIDRSHGHVKADPAVLNPLSKQIIACALIVRTTLGRGFLEKVYENALTHELRKAGLAADPQRAIPVTYDGMPVGDCVVDILVEQAIMVEVTTVAQLNGAHRAQCLNYLRATGLHLCLLLNFSRPHLEVCRIVRDL